MTDQCDACGTDRPLSDTPEWVPAGQPRCHYGAGCKRQNPQHFKDESHPPSHAKVTEYKIFTPAPRETKIEQDPPSASADPPSPTPPDSPPAPSASAPASSSAAVPSPSPPPVSSTVTSAPATSAPATSAPAASPAKGSTKGKTQDIRSFFTPSSSPSKTAPESGRKLPAWAKGGDSKDDAPRKKPKTDAAPSGSSTASPTLSRSPASARPVSPTVTATAVPTAAAPVPPPGGLLYIGRKATAAASGSGGGGAAASSGWAQTKKGFLEMLAALERSEKDKGDRMRAKVCCC
eukprot:685666-Rhodomonas_salina.4